MANELKCLGFDYQAAEGQSTGEKWRLITSQRRGRG